MLGLSETRLSGGRPQHLSNLPNRPEPTNVTNIFSGFTRYVNFREPGNPFSSSSHSHGSAQTLYRPPTPFSPAFHEDIMEAYRDIQSRRRDPLLPGEPGEYNTATGAHDEADSDDVR